MKSASPVKILNIIDQSQIGGGQQIVFLLSAYMDRSKYTPLVCCSGKGPLVEQCRDQNIEVFTISMNKKFNPLSMLRLICLIKKENIKLIHSHGLVATVFALPAAKINRIPIIYSQHGFHHYNYSLGFSRRMRVAVEKKIIQAMDLTICDSHDNRNKGLAEGYFNHAQAQVVFPPIDISRFKAADYDPKALIHQFQFADYSPIIGTVGRLDPAKGFDVMLKAIAMIKHSFPKLLFLFVGDGPLKQELMEKCRLLRLEGQVRFMGRQPEIPPFLALFDLFMQSSLWEGLPLVLGEAMAMEKAVIATNVGGCPEVVRHQETGLIVPANDPGALADAAVSLLKNPGQLAGFAQASRNRIEDHFSIQQVIQIQEEIYARLLENHPKKRKSAGE
jgi:glycosyltransferase involved in cell wall biosynthesis